MTFLVVFFVISMIGFSFYDIALCFLMIKRTDHKDDYT
jgi:hypothetical protein